MTRRFSIPLTVVVLIAAACSGGDDTGTTVATGDAGSVATSGESPSVASTTPTSQALAAFDGAWSGELVEGYTFQVRLERGADGALTGVLDALTDGITDLVLTSIIENGTHLEMLQVDGAAFFSLDLSEDGASLSGTAELGGDSYPIELAHSDTAITLDRPQEPVPPYPYEVSDVTFTNEDAGITFAGTLTMPEGAGPFAGAVLVTGSGPQNRDEELLGHKPFLVLADALTRSGIAVLRYDDRGFGESGGDFTGATTIDFADDAAAAVEFLSGVEGIDAGAVGIVGHSEGGLVAPIVATGHGGVAWIVLLAGTGVDGASVLIAQTERGSEVAGVDPDITELTTSLTADLVAVSASDLGENEAYAELTRLVTDGHEQLTAAGVPITLDGALLNVDVFLDPWMRAFLRFDPTETLQSVDVPVLALLGGLDVQVLPDQNEGPLRAAFEAGRSPDWEVRVMPGLNHLFQHATTGSVAEYATIPETMSPEVLDLVAAWIVDHSG